jgi:hypothetical protein
VEESVLNYTRAEKFVHISNAVRHLKSICHIHISTKQEKFLECAQTLCIVKEGCKYLNPSNGAREQLVTNFRSKQRSVGLNPLMTCIMSKNVRTILIFIFAVGKQN